MKNRAPSLYVYAGQTELNAVVSFTCVLTQQQVPYRMLLVASTKLMFQDTHLQVYGGYPRKCMVIIDNSEPFIQRR